MSANFDKLMDCRKATNNGPISNLYMASQGYIVDEDDMIANLTIMGYVRIGHDKAFATEDCFP